jgi:hypothetical protein
MAGRAFQKESFSIFSSHSISCISTGSPRLCSGQAVQVFQKQEENFDAAQTEELQKSAPKSLPALRR